MRTFLFFVVLKCYCKPYAACCLRLRRHHHTIPPANPTMTTAMPPTRYQTQLPEPLVGPFDFGVRPSAWFTFLASWALMVNWSLNAQSLSLVATFTLTS